MLDNTDMLLFLEMQNTMYKKCKGSKNGQSFQFFVLCSKNVLRYGPITSQIFRGPAILEPPKRGAKVIRRGSGGDQKKHLLLWISNYNKWEWGQK